MALTNYGELQTSVASWLNRTDLTGTIPDLIYLGRNRVWLDLVKLGGASILESSATGTTTGTISMPSDWLATRSLKVEVSGVQTEMRPVAPAAGMSSSGTPVDYYLAGTGVVLSPVPDGTYNYTLRYFAKLAAWTADADTDVILSKFPHMYLYAALLEAQPFLMDDARMMAWNAAYNERLATVVLLDKSRYGDMAVRADRVGG